MSPHSMLSFPVLGYYSSALYAILIYASLRGSNGSSYFPPEEKAGLSILNLKSHLWKNGFLNVIGVPLPPPKVNGPFGYGNELEP